jgi:hypothetical protein
MSGQPKMIAPGQMAAGRLTEPVGAPPVASLEAQTSTSDWFERARHYAAEAFANADGERRFSWESPRWRDPDAAAQHLVEHERRFRNAPAQGQRGAIDDSLTIAH